MINNKKRRYFQWIDGEQKGDVVTLESMEKFEDEIFYNFDDGESCNSRFISKMTNTPGDLKNKFMVEIESPSNPWTFEIIQPKKYIDESMRGEDIDIPSLHDILQANGDTSNIKSNIGSEKIVPPRRQQRLIELPSFADYDIELTKEKKRPIPLYAEQPKVVVETQQPVAEPQKPVVETVENTTPVKTEQKQVLSDPIKILVDTCKKHETSIDLSIKMMLPSIAIATIAVNEFEGGLDRFIDCIIGDINLNMIKDELKSALTESYSSSIVAECT